MSFWFEKPKTEKKAMTERGKSKQTGEVGQDVIDGLDPKRRRKSWRGRLFKVSGSTRGEAQEGALIEAGRAGRGGRNSSAKGNRRRAPRIKHYLDRREMEQSRSHN